MSAEYSWIAICVVTTTVASAEDAQRLASSLVQARLAACAQTEIVTSHYVWQQALHEDREWRVVFKTLPDALQGLTQRLRAEHPYEVPQLLVRTEQCLADYAQWVRDGVDS
ncbi:divalent-cation tolerance protein CutA [Acidovorax sp. CCYZU-2555]|uniref:divalent-cation tolerance protein CutA n=1 Tax=Acidovorax sp. CCYZU-2555 TaxID=2835042 RepID=UPI001BCC9CE4|nr:divalent-cation tolerance protein CutA [Acidovorax sp. CCYZU-2555]MBS7779062.1 divalent-cation tolerance protein CutA [Acidovorax sp. CCYZU-2555]